MEYIFYAGAHWKEFDYEAGFDELIKTDRMEYVYKAGCLWRRFDFLRAWKRMEYFVDDGEEWRGRAFDHERWRNALRLIWDELWEREGARS
ncbi:MAG: hypothetical protein BWY96_03128 [Spirochaetes bacterium ADurb.BinA120]|nr:MAG: hypothetical protein BWY96_03128 [Spirochaetes bacterium ADurb.BinA120]